MGTMLGLRVAHVTEIAHHGAAAPDGASVRLAPCHPFTAQTPRPRAQVSRAPYAALLRMALREADVSHEQAARWMGIPRQWVTAMCSGERGIELAHVRLLPSKARELMIPALLEEFKAA